MPSTVKIERPTFRYKVPETTRQFQTDPTSFALRPITADEERRANEVAEGTKSPLAVELVRMSVCEVNGQAVNWDKGDPDWIDKCSPKVRQLIFRAFAKVNTVADKDEADFLASEEVVT